jgi:hypothetical protein
MIYKRKVLVLAITAAVLALIYAGTLLLAPERLNARNAAYTWLEPRWADQAERVEISSGGETVALVCRNALWYVETAGVEYPAKQGRVADLLRVLSTRAAYPLRGSAASSHERLGLTEDAASRIVVRPAGPGAAIGSPEGNRPLLDLLIGTGGATGSEVFLRKNGRNEVRSGEDRFTVYLSSLPDSWYDLRLFPPEASSQRRAPTLDMVQRVTVIAPDSPAPLVVTRNETGWTVDELTADTLDGSRVDPFIRAILDAEGDGFVTALSPNDPVFNEGSVRLELGDGSSRTIRLGPLVQDTEGGAGRRAAIVSGLPYVYALAEWTTTRLFRDTAYFSR